MLWRVRLGTETTFEALVLLDWIWHSASAGRCPMVNPTTCYFCWEVFSVPNLKRFDVQTINSDISSMTFGNYSGLLTQPGCDAVRLALRILIRRAPSDSSKPPRADIASALFSY